MRVEGSEGTKTKISDFPCWLINVQGDWIFYATEGSFGIGKSIRKVRTGGQEDTHLVSTYTHWIGVTGEWVYFNNWDDRQNPGDCFRMHHDGMQQERLN